MQKDNNTINQKVFAASRKTEASVRVVARLRPLLGDELRSPESYGCSRDGKSVEQLDKATAFNLHLVFDHSVDQVEVYRQAGKPIIDDVLQGYNGTIFAYGQTGSGKTFTMYGPGQPKRDLEGLVPRGVRHIFKHIRESTESVEFILRVSLLEVYREQLRDLLNPNSTNLKIKESPARGVFVEGLCHEFVVCETDVYQLLAVSERCRAVAATRLNEKSSRSHVLFMLTCEQKMPDGTEKVGKLNLVDLAGSEKVWKSGSSGDTLEEAKKINWSLAALGNVINALREKRPHIPYRDSKLTRILQETLGGNFKTTLICCCTTSALHAEETTSSLNFATRAKSVCNHVKVNLLYSAEQLMQLVEKLQRDLVSSRFELAKQRRGHGGEDSDDEFDRSPFDLDRFDVGGLLLDADDTERVKSLAEKVKRAEKEKEKAQTEIEQWRRVTKESRTTIQGLEAALAMQEQVLEETRVDRDRLLREALQRPCPPLGLDGYPSGSIGVAVQVPLYELVHADVHAMGLQATVRSLNWRFQLVQHVASSTQQEKRALEQEVEVLQAKLEQLTEKVHEMQAQQLEGELDVGADPADQSEAPALPQNLTGDRDEAPNPARPKPCVVRPVRKPGRPSVLDGHEPPSPPRVPVERSVVTTPILEPPVASSGGEESDAVVRTSGDSSDGFASEREMWTARLDAHMLEFAWWVEGANRHAEVLQESREKLTAEVQRLQRLLQLRNSQLTKLAADNDKKRLKIRSLKHFASVQARIAEHARSQAVQKCEVEEAEIQQTLAKVVQDMATIADELPAKSEGDARGEEDRWRGVGAGRGRDAFDDRFKRRLDPAGDPASAGDEPRVWSVARPGSPVPSRRPDPDPPPVFTRVGSHAARASPPRRPGLLKSRTSPAQQFRL